MELTAEQKEQLKMARRASMRIEETWSMYCMFLSHDKKPSEALELAQEAVGVWVEWMDHNEVEPPDIHRPDFSEEVTKAVKSITEHMQKNSSGAGMLELDQSAGTAKFRPLSDGPEQKS